MNGMNMLGLGIVLTLKDRVSSGLNSLRQKMVGFGKITNEMVKNFDEATAKILGGLTSITAGFKGFNLLESMFAPSVNVSMGIEAAFARVKAVSNATKEELKALEAQAEKLGRDTRFTISDVFNAQENLIRAGLNIEKTQAAVPHALNLALAEGLELPEAGDMIATTMSQFGLAAEDAERIGNVFAEASRSSSLSSRTLFEALRYVAPTAKNLNMSLEETVAWLGTLSNAGLRGSIGGTGLNASLTRLLDPKTAKNLASSMGIEMEDAVSHEDVMKRISEALSGLDASSKTTALFNIFGKIGFKGAAAMLDGVEGSFSNLFTKLKDTNALKEMSAIMDDTAEGAVKRLESATEALNKAIGDNLKEAFRSVFETAARFKARLAEFIKDHPVLSKAIIGTVTVLISLASTALIAIGTLMTIGGAIKLWRNVKPVISEVFTSMITKSGSVKAAFAGMSTPILALIALAGALYLAYENNLFGIRDMFEAIGTGFNMAMNADKNGIIEIEDETLKRLQDAGLWESSLNMGAVFFRFRKFFEGFADGVVAGIDRIKNAFAKIGGFISDTFGGIFGEGTFFNDLLKEITPESSVDSWEEWGKIIGEIATGLFAIIVAIKGISLASSLLGALTNPLGTILVLVTALVAYWDKWQAMVESFWGFFDNAPKSLNPVQQAGTQNYETLKKRAEDRGWVIDDNGKVQRLPKDILMYASTPAEQQPYIEDMEAQLRQALKVTDLENQLNQQQKIQNLMPQGKYDFLKQQNQGAPYIIQHHENQADMNSEAVNSTWPEALKMFKVDNKMQVEVSGVPFTINLDGEPILQQVLSLQETHSIRQGGGDM